MPSQAAATALDLAGLVLATFIGTIGLLALAIVVVRWRRTDRTTTLVFGLFCLLYGIRECAWATAALPPDGLSPHALDVIATGITYVIAIPLTIFAERFLGQGWRRSIRILIYVEAAYAVVAVATDLATGHTGTTLWVNALLVSLFGPMLIANALRPAYRATREGRLFAFGLAAFIVVALYPNLSTVLDWHMSVDPEPIGLLIFVGCLGYLSLTRVEDTERRLLAIEHELEAARRIQTAILPHRPPAAAGLDIAARYVPMTAVAGDFYDFLPADGSRLGVLVADVSGHGIGAALIASMLKVALNAQGTRAADPSAVLGGLNTALCGKFDRDYVTAAYLLVDPPQGTLAYAGAGHPPPLVRQPSTGRIEELDQNGLIMGLFDSAEYANVAEPVEAGTRVVLYTDGVIEARNHAGDFFGIERLRDFLKRHASLPAGPFADTLLQELGTWVGRSTGHDDDVTVVVVDFCGSPHEEEESEDEEEKEQQGEQEGTEPEEPPEPQTAGAERLRLY